jgi:putative heme-binding domain-containing protein
MAQGPDGAFYLTDWVFNSYPIHSRGRLWKLEIENQPWIAKKQPETPEAVLAKKLRQGHETPELTELLQLSRGSDKYLADAALSALSKSKLSVEAVKALLPADRVWAFVAMRRRDLNDAKWVRAFFDDPDAEMRFECLRWIADAVLKDFQPQVEAMLIDPKIDFRLFEAVLATWNTLRGDPAAGVTNPEVLVERITDSKTPARLKGYALRLAPPTHKSLTLELLRDFANSDDEILQLEAVRTLAARRASADIAADDKHSPKIRAEAILGTDDPALLQKLARSDLAIIRDEAQRALPRSLTINRPAFDDTTAWLRLLEGQGDPETGRRIFFNSKVALCSSCHRHSGRGNVVGPDLTLIAQQGDRAAILRSILEPHREVAPQFYPSVVELKDGTTFTGILLRSSSTEVFRDLTGKEKSFPEADIIKRTELRTSLMPPGLVMSLTNAELRDLLAFLTSP